MMSDLRNTVAAALREQQRAFVKIAADEAVEASAELGKIEAQESRETRDDDYALGVKDAAERIARKLQAA